VLPTTLVAEAGVDRLEVVRECPAAFEGVAEVWLRNCSIFGTLLLLTKFRIAVRFSGTREGFSNASQDK
jgi:hypothetical protein